MDQKSRLSTTTAIIILILMFFVFFSGISILLYMALAVDINLSIGALVFGFCGLVWFRRSGWYLLSKDVRIKITQALPFNKS